MTKKGSVLISLMVLLCFSANKVQAQFNTLYFMDVPAQDNMMNPAFQPKRSTLELGISLFTYFDNSSLTLNDMFTESDQNNVVYWDFENIDRILRNENYVHLGLGTTPLFLGIKVSDNWYLNFSTSIEYHSTFTFPKSISEIRYGNADIDGEKPRTVALSDYSLDEFSFHEYAFGASLKLADKLFLGIKAKALMGLSAVKTNRFNASIVTSDDFTQSTLETDVDIDVSGLVFESNKEDMVFRTKGALDEFLIGKNASSFKNFGTAFDFGLHYYVTPRWDIHFSLVDWGSIRWALKPQKLISKGKYTFDGIEFSPYQLSEDDFEFNEYLQQYADTITSKFIPTTQRESFKTDLSARWYLGTNYSFSKFHAHAMASRQHIEKRRVNKAGLGLTWDANKYISLTGSFSYSNYWFYNVGLGMRVNAKHVQFYLVSDNLNAIDIGNVRALNIAFGFSVRLWRGQPDFKQYWYEPDSQ